MANPDLGFLRHCLLLKPPLLLLSPLPQSLSGFGNLTSGLLPGSAVVPQKLLDVSGTVAVPLWGVWNSAVEIRPLESLVTNVPGKLEGHCFPTWCCQSLLAGAAAGILCADWASRLWRRTWRL